jgi:hypothetical protein
MGFAKVEFTLLDQVEGKLKSLLSEWDKNGIVNYRNYANDIIKLVSDNSQDKAESNPTAPNSTHSEISLLKDAVHLISGDYCSYNHRDLAIKNINAVLAKLQNVQ